MDRDIVKLILAKKQGFTGRYCTNTLTKRLLNDFRWKDGRVVSSTVLRPKGGKIPEGNVRVAAQVCYDWFKTTTFYYTDGSYFIDQQYLGRTCSGIAEPGENQEFQTDLNGGALLEAAPDTLDCSQLKQFGADTSIKSSAAQLRDSATSSSNETAFTFERQTNGQYIKKQVIPGTANSVDLSNIPQSAPVDVVIHNHPGGLATFSLVDVAAIYGLYTEHRMKSWSSFMLGVIIGDGSMYVLRITDIVKFAAFGSDNLTPFNYNSWQNTYNYSASDNLGYQISKLTRAIEDSGLELYKTTINNLENGFSRLDAVPEGVQYYVGWPCK